jgi:O-antigen/teichoic acid export membrane protein
MAGIYIEKKTKYLPFITGLGAVINIALNITLIPVIGLYGAAAAALISYLAMFLYIYRVSHKFYPVKYELKKVYLLHLVNIIALALFYISFYQIFYLNLLVRLVVSIILVLAIARISGLTQARKLIGR